MNQKPRTQRRTASTSRRKTTAPEPPAAAARAEAGPVSPPETQATPPGHAPETPLLEHALEALSVDHETAERLQRLPRDVGWLLMTAGVVGVVMPGVLGVPFLLIGGLIVSPATNKHAERWLSGHAPGVFKGSIRQINRFLDDLERRYPRRSRS